MIQLKNLGVNNSDFLKMIRVNYLLTHQSILLLKNKHDVNVMFC